MVLSWRNHPEVKKWMYNVEDISIENHLLFIDNLKTSKDKKYFLVQDSKYDIGVIDFTNIDSVALECDFGLYANPFLKIQGTGKILQEACIRYAFDVLKMGKLRLDVFCDNTKAINLYQQHNFKKVGEKQIRGRDLICMELGGLK
jgi:UDP-4-amino-4,6-dideoxy-N-acetyl-beta-L-altrosamine N-acetyltransferase